MSTPDGCSPPSPWLIRRIDQGVNRTIMALIWGFKLPYVWCSVLHSCSCPLHSDSNVWYLFRHYVDRSRCNGTSGCICMFFTRWMRYGYKIPPQDYLNIVRLWKWMCELWCTSWVLMFLCELRACLVQKFYLIIYYQRHLITLFIVWFGCYVINWRGIRYLAFKTMMLPTFWHYIIVAEPPKL